MSTADRPPLERDPIKRLTDARWEPPGSYARGVADGRAEVEAAGVVVTRDTLDQWIEDALTQGIAPASYVFNVLSAALAEASHGGASDEAPRHVDGTLPPLHGGYRPSPTGRKIATDARGFPKPPSGAGGGSRASDAAVVQAVNAALDEVERALSDAFSGDEYQENCEAAAGEAEWSWWKWLATTTVREARRTADTTPEGEQ